MIARERNEDDAEILAHFSKSGIMQFFLKLAVEILADLAMELGKKKSEAILENGIEATTYHELFRQTINVAESTEINIQRMNAWMMEQHRDISSKDLFNGFKSIITFLLREEYHLLGAKSLKTTVQRLVEIADAAPQEERRIATPVAVLLNRVLHDQRELVGTDGSFSGLTTDNETNAGLVDVPFPHLSQIEGATIIAFYSRILQMIMDDLEGSIGSKSNELMLKIVSSSQYNDKFLSQFNVKDDVKTNVERIRQYISDKGYRLSKASFIKGFQQVLFELLREERLLLGDRSARASILKIERLVPILKQNEFKWLAENLLRTIPSLGDLKFLGG